MARTLHARLYVSPTGQIFAVGGRIARDQLERTLSRYDCSPALVNAPTPVELGIASCDGELSPALLHTIGQALQRWQKELAAEMQQRPAQRRHRIQLEREQAELARLTARLATLRNWKAELAEGHELFGAPHFLDEVAEADLQRALLELGQPNPVPSVIAWQARIVFWIAGSRAAWRFLKATAELRLFDKNPGASLCEEVRSFQQVVRLLKRRSEQESVQHLHAELKQYLRNMRPEVVTKGRLTSRLRERTFSEHCDLLVSRCAKMLAKTSRFRKNLIPAALAALVATDGSSIAIPTRILRAGITEESYLLLARRIASLADQAGQAGYDVLLSALGQLSEAQHTIEYYQLRLLLVKGSKLIDALWACQQELFYVIQNSCLSLGAIRKLLETFSERGIPLDCSDSRQLVLRLDRSAYSRMIYTWLNWVGSVSKDSMTPRMQDRLRAVLWDFVVPVLPMKDWVERITGCLKKPRRGQGDTDCTPLLDRIREYQRMSGRLTELPKTIRKLIHGSETREQELAHLRQRQAAGLLNDNARLRMEYLERCGHRPTDLSKLRRAAEEVYLLFGIEAMRNMAQQMAEATCASYLGEVLHSLSSGQFLKFAIWIEKMSEYDQNRLRELIEAHSTHGCEYKRHLAENESWIAQAEAHGLDLRPWFTAETHKQTIGGVSIEIEVTRELHHIFLMGTYFSSCLSLGDCNEMSVLANATDANKQVIFMFARSPSGERRMLARQLIAISSDFELLGYNCYCTYDEDVRLKCAEIQNAIAAYCGRLAAACGIKLANQGSPAAIAEHFWYDDGELQWSAAAEAAWKETFVQIDQLVIAAC